MCVLFSSINIQQPSEPSTLSCRRPKLRSRGRRGRCDKSMRAGPRSIFDVTAAGRRAKTNYRTSRAGERDDGGGVGACECCSVQRRGGVVAEWVKALHVRVDDDDDQDAKGGRHLQRRPHHCRRGRPVLVAIMILDVVDSRRSRCVWRRAVQFWLLDARHASSHSNNLICALARARVGGDSEWWPLLDAGHIGSCALKATQSASACRRRVVVAAHTHRHDAAMVVAAAATAMRPRDTRRE